MAVSSSTALDWHTARAVAATSCEPLSPIDARLTETNGCILVTPLVALADVPAFAAAAMDGYAVNGHGPWLIGEEVNLAGGTDPGELGPGQASAIATGALIPPGATAVMRDEDAVIEGALHGMRLFTRDALTGLADESSPALPPGTNIRPQGEECRIGDVLIEPGLVVTPAMLGLAAATGYDTLAVIPPPSVAVLVMGDELLDRGLPRPGRPRDALGPLLPGWLAALGARAHPPIRVPDSIDGLLAEIADANVDVIVTTGSTARGPVDHLHAALDRMGARWIVDGVSVRPGHPMLLAQLPDGRPLVGLPGNPLAAASGVVTLVAPLIAAMRGLSSPPLGGIALLAEDITAHPHDVRLVPVSIEIGEIATMARPLTQTSPAMLRGLALSDGFAVIEPGGGQRGSSVEVLANPTYV